jgi:hypothetical protein
LQVSVLSGCVAARLLAIYLARPTYAHGAITRHLQTILRTGAELIPQPPSTFNQSLTNTGFCFCARSRIFVRTNLNHPKPCRTPTRDDGRSDALDGSDLIRYDRDPRPVRERRQGLCPQEYEGAHQTTEAFSRQPTANFTVLRTVGHICILLVLETSSHWDLAPDNNGEYFEDCGCCWRIICRAGEYSRAES